MKALPLHADLLQIAPRIIWFEPPAQALADSARFMAYLMTYGTPEDIATVRALVGETAFRDAVETVPPGIMDERSWAYWNVMAGKEHVPPMPLRKLPVHSAFGSLFGATELKTPGQIFPDTA